MANLPYVTAPGAIDRAFTAIKAAATPERITQDFVKTILQIPGGSGDQIASFLKKIGFANADGTPSEIYKGFRNPTTSGKAALQALKAGYAPLYKRNEYMHKLPDKDLQGLIIEETGQSKDSSVVRFVLASIKTIKKHVSEPAATEEDASSKVEPALPPVAWTASGNHRQEAPSNVGLNLAYTINLNLPATSDVAVFNAIFKSLKEHLLKDTNG